MTHFAVIVLLIVWCVLILEVVRYVAQLYFVQQYGNKSPAHSQHLAWTMPVLSSIV